MLFYAKKSAFKYAEATAYNQFANIYILKNIKLDSTQYYLQQIDKTLPVINEISFLAEVNKTKGYYYIKIKKYKEDILKKINWL